MESDLVEKHLQTLRNVGTGVLQISEALKCLKEVFMSDLGVVDGRVYVTKTLDRQKGLPNFISRASTKPSTITEAKEAIELLEIVVKNHSKVTDLKICEFLVWCANFMQSDAGNDIKGSVIKTGLVALQQCPCISVEWEKVMGPVINQVTSYKCPPTFVDALFSFLAEICEKYPEQMNCHVAWFFNEIQKAFLKYNSVKNVSDKLAEAAFNGLHGLLVHFPLPGQSYSNYVYEQVSRFLQLKHEARQRNTVGRAAGRLFSKHVSLFKSSLCSQHEMWHQKLLEWIDVAQSRDNQQVGLQCLISFYHTIAQHILTLPPEEGKPILSYYSAHFQTQHSVYHITYIKDVLHGLSEFVPVFQKLSSEEQVLAIVERTLATSPIIRAIQLEVISKLTMDSQDLSRHCVALITDFPQIEFYQRPYCLKSLEHSISSWHSKEPDFAAHLDVVIYQSLLHSCAGPILADVELLREKEKLISCLDYLPLWKHLLTVSLRSNTGLSEDSKRSVGRLLFDSFVTNFLKIISKLNLTLSCVSFETSDPSVALEADSPTDFQIFVNLVELFEKLIPHCDESHVVSPTPEIVSTMIDLSRASPMVSGYLKVIAVCFKATAVQNYWIDADLQGLRRFLGEILQRIGSQKDDLLVASLRVVLSSPVRILSPHLHLLKSVPTITARAAAGYFPLWALLLEALQRWHSQLPEHTVLPIVLQALPCLTSSLLAADIEDANKKLFTLQRDFLLFFASLDSFSCLEALAPTEDAWFISDDELTYKIHLADREVNLQLNPILNRVCKMAESCPNRSTRIMAAQILHAFILLSLAKARDRPSKNPQVLQGLLRTGLVLASDKDRIIHNLFSQLFTQMTHYFSSRSQLLSEESAVFITVLMDGLTHVDDFGVRDFSGACIREFTVWSERQSEGRSTDNAPFNIVGIIRSLCEFAVHPERTKRIGAAVAFNHLYDQLRENRRILSDYWLRLYYYFITSLEMSVSEEESQIVAVAVKHIQRPFLEKISMFRTCPTSRRIPPGFQSGTITEIAAVTLKHCQSSNSHLRKVSQDFFKDLKPRIPDLKCDLAFEDVTPESLNYEKKLLGILDCLLWQVRENFITAEGLPKVSLSMAKLFNGYLTADPEFSLSHISSNRVIVFSYMKLTVGYLGPDLLKSLAMFIFSEALSKAPVAEKSLIAEILASLVVKSPCFQSFLPDLSEDVVVKKLADFNNPEFCGFFQGLTLLRSSLAGRYSPRRLLSQVFSNLFRQMGERCFSVNLDYHVQVSFKHLVAWIFSDSFPPDWILEFMLDGKEVTENGVQTTKGKVFFGLFKESLIPFLSRQQDTANDLKPFKATGLAWLKTVLRGVVEAKPLEPPLKLIEGILSSWDWWTSCVSFQELVSVLKSLCEAAQASCRFFANRPLVRKWFFSVTSEANISDDDTVAFLSVLEQFVPEIFCEEFEKCLQFFKRKSWFFAPKSRQLVKSVVDSLLRCIGLTANPSVFRFYIEFVTLNPHLAEENSARSVFENVGKTFEEEKVLGLLDVIHEQQFNPALTEDSSSQNLKLFVTFLEGSPKSIVLKFFVLHIHELVQVSEAPMSTSPQLILKKIAAVVLMETFYLKTLQEDRVALQKTLDEKKGEQKVFQRMTKAANFSRYKPANNLIRQYNSACVSFTCVYAKNISDENKFRFILFQKRLWDFIVDDKKDHSVLFRGGKASSETKEKPKVRNSLRSTLFESTLKEDVRNFDLTDSFIGEAIVKSSITSNAEHEVLPAFTQLIQHMTNNGIHFWATYFAETLSSQPNRNIQLLVLKLIRNLGKISKEDCLILAPAVLDCLVQLGDSLGNVVLLDILQMLIGWRSEGVENFAEEGTKMAKIITIVIKTTPANTKKEADASVTTVKNVVESWEVDKTIIFDYLVANSSGDVMTSYVHLSFLLIIVRHIENPQSLLDWLLKSLDTPQNRDMAALIIGIVLQKSPDSVKPVVESIQQRSLNTIPCLYEIHKNFPKISGEFVRLLTQTVWQDKSQLKTACLEMLVSYVENYGLEDWELSASLSAMAADVLQSSVPLAQKHMLTIIEKVVESLSESDVNQILPSVIKISNSKDPSTRQLVFQIFIKLEKHHKDKCSDQVLVKLLAGINENKSCLEYWCSESIPKETNDRLLFVLEKMYKPEVEGSFLEYAVRILLHSATVVSKYDKPIFDHPLKDCAYADAPMLDSWRRGSCSLPPMFAPSVAAELYKLDMNLPTSQKTMKLRETAQTLLFEPTLIDEQPVQMDVTQTFKKPRVPRKYKKDGSTQNEEIKLYRSYRSGDYPDIMIKHSQLIEMLLEFVGKDSTFSKELFMVIFNGIADANCDNTFWGPVKTGMANILSASPTTDRFLVGAILQTALDNNIILPVADVSRVSMNSDLLSIGALLIERCLEQVEDEDGPAEKRQRMNVENEEDVKWLKLAALYYDAKHLTAVHSIFLHQLGIKGAARNALEAEAAGDLLSAVNFHETVMVDGSSEERRHFFSQSYFQCLAALSDWSKVLDCMSTVSEADLWEDQWCSRVLVPWKAKSLLMTDGPFSEFVFSNHENSPKGQILAQYPHFSAIGYWLEDEVADSLGRAVESLGQFHQKWIGTNKWDTYQKSALLNHLHLITEVQHVVNIKAIHAPVEELNSMLCQLIKGVPSEQNNLETWDLRLKLRSQLINELGKTYGDDFEDEQALLKTNVVTRYVQLAKAAVKQRNVSFARKCLKLAKDFGIKENEELCQQWRNVRQAACILDVTSSRLDSEEKLNRLLSLKAKSEEGSLARVEILAEMVKLSNNSNAVQISDLEISYMEAANDALRGTSNASKKAELLLSMAKIYKKSSWVQYTKSLLNAMLNGSFEAKQLFATVLKPDEMSDNPEILILSNKVPAWMFLIWRHQLLANVTRNPTQLVKSILLRIAHRYPAAISYGLRLTRENAESNSFLDELAALVLRNPVEEEFMKEIHRVNNPGLRVEYYLSKVIEAIGSSDQSVLERNAAHLKSMSEESDSFGGWQLDEILNKIEVRDTQGLKLQLYDMRARTKTLRLSNRLEDFSPWLAKYHWMNFEHTLEIPGQYDTEFEPVSKRNVLVASFKPNVTIINSLRQPIKVTILGNDAKEYGFLVKFGEDLRQDERIQQVLSQMDRTLSKTKTRLETYKVIPLSSNCGLIEWLDNTDTLRKLVGFSPETMEKARNDQLSFLSSSKEPITAHKQGYLSKNSSEVADAYQRRVSSFEKHSLRKSLWKVCSSPEHFFELRTNLAGSLSAMSVAHWLLGVGDRHLDNILISTKKGRVLGIDFGMAFGFATQFLPLPELVPFRLTPQMVNVFSPLGANGWLRTSMTQCLGALREDPSVLLGILEVFVLEPTIDWLQQAKRLADSSLGEQWYPQRKVEAVAAKLSGRHPLCSMEADLRAVKSGECLEKQVAVLLGDGSLRKGLLSESSLSASQQVACLLELATDPVVLGHTYVGWDPWV